MRVPLASCRSKWYNYSSAIGTALFSLLTRQQVIEQLEASGTRAESLAHWAFDQFYAEEQGTVEFEPGYRRAIGVVLDELMFADEPQFRLNRDHLRALADSLRAAQPGPDDEDDEDDELLAE